MRLEGKVAIVTGGSMGIGEAYTKGMAREGARVVIADINEEVGQNLVQLINKEGGSALFIKTDVSKKADVDALIEKTVAKYGKLDILVNNAAILETAPVEETTEEMWDKMLAVNVKGIFFCSQAAAKVMVKQKSGKIINVSSIAAVGAQPGLLVYSSTKGAVLTMSRVFALELCTSNIQVNSILPGTTDTGMAKQAMENPEWTRQVIQGIPMGRLGKTDDLLGALLFLLQMNPIIVPGRRLLLMAAYQWFKKE
jgi:NAD(P)-dependent dehydrogenase (short-subunit alcohol dehydrogenase family)